MNVHLKWKATIAALAVMSMAPVQGARAQAAAAAAGPVKIAIINMRNAIIATAEGKQAQAQLQSQFAPRQADLQNTQKQIEDLQRRLSEGARTLSDDEKGKMQREGELLTRRLQRNNDDLNEELNAAQGEVVDGIGRKLLDVLDRYSRENGYTIVLDTSAQGSPVVYGSSNSDITADIVRLYDQAYPVKTGAAATPAPKAATPTPAKKTTP
jgi:outer membrane protein